MVEALLTYVPLGGLIVSLGFNVVQLVDRRRAAKPRVIVNAVEPVGVLSWPDRREGMFTGDEVNALFLGGSITVAGSANITGARIAPVGQASSWDSLPEPDIYVGDPAEPDSGRRETGMGIAQIPDEHALHRLPKPLTDAQLVIRVELPARPPLREDALAQIWVQVDEKHYFRSEAAPLRRRFRGLPPGTRT